VDAGRLLAAGRQALRSGDAAGARTAFEAARGAAPDGAVLEGLAQAAFLGRSFDGAIELWERAYAAYRAGGDGVAAVRMARTLGGMHGTIRGDLAVSAGWVARAQRLLTSTPDAGEAGWVALTQGMFEGDRARKEDLFGAALAAGQAAGDSDLACAAMAYLGASLVHGDRTEEGMVLLDEALAAAAGGDIDDLCVIEEVFCQLFSACERARDVARAEEWLRVGDALAARRNLPSVAAYCHTHFGGVMTAAGRWAEAEAALTEAVRLWALGRRTLRSAALARLAELRVRQGRLEDAAALLAELPVDADSAAAVAALHLARREPARAHEVLERALRLAGSGDTGCVPLLGLLVEVQLAAGDVAGAAESEARLESCVGERHSPYLDAMVALARGWLAQATDAGDPTPLFREAADGFVRAQLPWEAGRARLALAEGYAARDPDVALAEARAALDRFERLRAARHVDAAAALLRSLGARVVPARGDGGLLTTREQEVLGLLGHGLSNPEIATRLFISRKTVEHHVGNVLAKLGLRTRAEAAAYAVRRGLG
jgi:DNA-binding CsgD family transcriptional regulator